MINQNFGFAPIGRQYYSGGYGVEFQAMFATMFCSPQQSFNQFGGTGCGMPQGICGFPPPPQFGNACGGYMDCCPGYGGQGFGAYPPMCGGGYGGSYGGSFGGGFGAGAAVFGQLELPGQQNKMWDVWFDSKDGQKTVQRSPIVLDLNGNGQADITGKNVLGDGRIDGPTTMFDLDPNKVSYEFKSQQRRPGSGAPDVKGGYWVNDKGERVKQGPPKGTQKKFDGWKYMDPKGNVVGEMKNDGLYHYGKQEKREQTEWLKKNGGDGFLVSDYNKDGQINDATELFGTEGPNGKKYKNGYEKLAALHDTNKDGKISGKELENLKVWKDSNADGKVQDGELQSLAKHGVTSFDVSKYDAKTMEGSYGTNEQTIPFMAMAAVGGGYSGQYGGGYGGQFGNPYGGGQFGNPYGGGQFGNPYGGGQFGNLYGGGQFGNPYGGQFGNPYGGQFGQFGGQSSFFAGGVVAFGFGANWMNGYA